MPKGQRKQAQEKIDQKTFEKLCGIQCTEEEIASIFGVSVATIERWCMNTYSEKFADVFRQKRLYGKASLRRAQWLKGVDDHDTTMLIFLGKQYLGQADRVSQSITTITSETRDELNEIMHSIDKELYEGEEDNSKG